LGCIFRTTYCRSVRQVQEIGLLCLKTSIEVEAQDPGRCAGSRRSYFIPNGKEKQRRWTLTCVCGRPTEEMFAERCPFLFPPRGEEHVGPGDIINSCKELSTVNRAFPAGGLPRTTAESIVSKPISISTRFRGTCLEDR
jgi:hypothetical protein